MVLTPDAKWTGWRLFSVRIRLQATMIRAILRYLPLPVASACYVYMLLKMYLDIADQMDSTDFASIKLNILLYIGFVIAPGLLAFVITAKWRFFKWVYLLLIIWLATGTAQTHFVMNGRHECEYCMLNVLGLLLITWPVFLAVGLVALVKWTLET